MKPTYKTTEWDTRPSDKKNISIVKKYYNSYAKCRGPRVGDFILFPNKEHKRITHIWEDGTLQTNDGTGSFAMDNGYISYSGSLNHGVDIKNIKKTNKTKRGVVWIPHHGFLCAGCAVHYNIHFRVFKSKVGEEI